MKRVRVIALGLGILISLGSVGVASAEEDWSKYLDENDPFWQSEVAYAQELGNHLESVVGWDMYLFDVKNTNGNTQMQEDIKEYCYAGKDETLWTENLKYGGSNSKWGIKRTENGVAPRGMLPTEGVKRVEKLKIDKLAPYVSSAPYVRSSATVDNTTSYKYVKAPWARERVGFVEPGEYLVEVWDENTTMKVVGKQLNMTITPIRREKTGWTIPNGVYIPQGETDLMHFGASAVLYAVTGEKMQKGEYYYIETETGTDVPNMSVFDPKNLYYSARHENYVGALDKGVGQSKIIKYEGKPVKTPYKLTTKDAENCLAGIYKSTVLPNSTKIIDINGELETIV